VSRYHNNKRTVVKRVVQINVFWLSPCLPDAKGGEALVAYNNVNKRNATYVTSNATVLLRTLRPNSLLKYPHGGMTRIPLTSSNNPRQGQSPKSNWLPRSRASMQALSWWRTNA